MGWELLAAAERGDDIRSDGLKPLVTPIRDGRDLRWRHTEQLQHLAPGKLRDRNHMGCSPHR